MPQRVRSLVDRALEAVLIALMSAMTLAVVWQVASRDLLGDPSSVTEELARFLLIWLGLLGAAYAFGQRAHVALPGLLRRAGRRSPRLAALGRWIPIVAVGLFAITVLGIGGARLMALVLDLEQRSAALGIPLGWVYAALPLSAAAILAYCLCEAFGAPSAKTPSARAPSATAEPGDGA
jgi:TRAP-type C4-dicarboxylate transport system permease small subunit